MKPELSTGERIAALFKLSDDEREEMARQNADLVAALQEIQRWAEYAYGKPHDFTAKLGAIAKAALARHREGDAV